MCVRCRIHVAHCAPLAHWGKRSVSLFLSSFGSLSPTLRCTSRACLRISVGLKCSGNNQTDPKSDLGASAVPHSAPRGMDLEGTGEGKEKGSQEGEEETFHPRPHSGSRLRARRRRMPTPSKPAGQSFLPPGGFHITHLHTSDLREHQAPCHSQTPEEVSSAELGVEAKDLLFATKGRVDQDTTPAPTQGCTLRSRIDRTPEAGPPTPTST